MKTPKILILVSLLSLAFSAEARLALRLELENEMEKKVTKIVQTYDPYASVEVKVEFKRIGTALPGTDSVIANLTDIKSKETLSEQDISKVKVLVTYSKADLEAQAGETLKSALGSENLPVDIQWKSYGPEILENIKRSDISTQVGRLLTEIKGFMWALGGLAVLLALVAIGFFRQSQNRTLKNWSDNFRNLVSALETDEPALTRDVTSSSETPSVAASGEGRSQVQELEASALLALLSDCYWCEEDGYASWLWNQASQKQRENLLQAWEPLAEYATHLMTTAPQAKDYHLHPSYLAPTPLQSVSQKDLRVFVEQNPTMFLKLTPVRRQHLTLSLENKLKLLNGDTKAAGTQWPKLVSELRTFKRQIQMGQVQLEEEEMILQNPEMIPQNYRAFFPTLVWARHLPEDVKRELLSRYSAQDLARAWLGPVQLLEELETYLPEKKRNLLKGYLRQVQPARTAPAYQALVEDVLTQLERKSISA